MKKQYLECGKIVSTHGVMGEVKVQAWCDEPDELLGIKKLWLDEGKTPVKVKGARLHKDMVLLKLDGIDNMDKAQNDYGVPESNIKREGPHLLKWVLLKMAVESTDYILFTA